jgi:serine/threonine-protein kinase
MSDPQQPEPEAFPALETVLVGYLLAEERGNAPAPAQVVADYPQLAQELTTFFECRQEVPRFRATGLDTGPLAQTVAGLELLEVLGRGAMGIVYKARQKPLRRLVAVKVIRGGDHSAADLARFRGEAEKLAQLQHPNIVQIFDAGEDQGRPYFAMELVEGGSLAARLAQGWLPTARQAAALVRELAGALAWVHQCGICHRDLKPANILLEAGDRPKIADFGLAKQLGDEGNFTATGAVVGTASYMAPEQAAGQSRQVGPAADIYALGAILYELLAGRPPFLGATLLDTLDQVRRQEPFPLRQLCPGVDRDLETICLKCLRKRPEERYASATELADRLDQFLRGQPIPERPETVIDWFSRVVKQTGLMGNFSALWPAYFAAGLVFFACHAAVFVGLRSRWPEWPLWLALVGPLALLAAIFRRHPSPWTWRNSWANRQLWSIWGGHFLATVTMLISFRLQAPDAAQAVQLAYPAVTALTGLAFFVMGTDYWGRYYLFGLLWLVAAILMALTPTWAPLEAAVLTLASLWQIALVMRRLALEQARASAPTDTPAKRNPTPGSKER